MDIKMSAVEAVQYVLDNAGAYGERGEKAKAIAEELKFHMEEEQVTDVNFYFEG